MSINDDSEIARLKHELAEIEGQGQGDGLEGIRAKKALAKAYRDKGDYDSAIGIYRTVLSLERVLYEDWNAELIITVNALGVSQYGAGNFARAKELLEPTLLACRGLCGDADETTVLVLRNLLASLAALGQYGELSEMRNEIIDECIHHRDWDLGALLDPESFLNNVLEVALFCSQVGELERAKRLYGVAAKLAGFKHVDLEFKAFVSYGRVLVIQGLLRAAGQERSDRYPLEMVAKRNARAHEIAGRRDRI